MRQPDWWYKPRSIYVGSWRVTRCSTHGWTVGKKCGSSGYTDEGDFPSRLSAFKALSAKVVKEQKSLAGIADLQVIF